MRLQHLGVRELLCLETPDKAEAAKKAKLVYCTVHSGPDGWRRVLELFRPEMIVSKEDITVGMYLEAVRTTGLLEEGTVQEYARKLRQIVAHVGCIVEAPGIRKSCHRGEFQGTWRKAVENVPLRLLTEAAVREWRETYLRATRSKSNERERANHTVDSIVRNARSLFTKAIWKKLSHLRLPQNIPFEGIELKTKGLSSYRFVATIDPIWLLAEARKELRIPAPELYKIFILALCAGLRRGEIDRLRRESLLAEAGQIVVFNHDHFVAKTEYSKDAINIERLLIQELLALQKAGEAFILPPKKIPEKEASYRRYWSANHFRSLCVWLRTKGINSDKPIHTLRKYFGCILAKEFGIYVASKGLRHSSVAVTEAYYLDNTKRAVPRLLGDGDPTMPALPSIEESLERLKAPVPVERELPAAGVIEKAENDPQGVALSG